MTIFIIIGSITVIALLWTLTAAEESIIHGYPSVSDTRSKNEPGQKVAHVEAHRPVRTASFEPSISTQALL